MFDVDPESLEECRITVVAIGSFGNSVLNWLRQNPQTAQYLSADEDYDDAAAKVVNSDLVFIVTGLEDARVASMAVEIATLAKTAESLVVAVTEHAALTDNGSRLEALQNLVDSLIPLSSDNLVPLNELPESSISEKAIATYIACQFIREISRTITERGIIGIDFADVKTILGGGGKRGYIGIGMANGENRGAVAAEKSLQAIEKQLELSEFSGILATITGSTCTKMEDYNDAVKVLHERVSDEVKIMVSIMVDEAFGENVRVMVVGKEYNSSSSSSSKI